MDSLSFLKNITKKSLIYRAFVLAIVLVVSLMLYPKENFFEYKFEQNKPWLYDNLFAPFAFDVEKLPQEVSSEKQKKQLHQKLYLRSDISVKNNLLKQIKNSDISNSDKRKLSKTITHIYKNGILESKDKLDNNSNIYIKKANSASKTSLSKIFLLDDAKKYLLQNVNDTLYSMFFNKEISPDLALDEGYTKSVLDKEINSISMTEGHIESGTLIVSKGEIVKTDVYKKLVSLKKKYEKSSVASQNYYQKLIGYILMTVLMIFLLILYAFHYQRKEFSKNNAITFIALNIILGLLLANIVNKINSNFIYIVPFSLFPIMIRSFFDSRIAIFTHTIIILIIAFSLPNSFEFVYLQFASGVIAVLTTKGIYKRVQYMLSIVKIIAVYCVAYLSIFLIQYGSFSGLEFSNFGLFIVNGLLIFLAPAITYMYEKMFGMISDISLLELSDMSSPVLRELSKKAPGTMQHSLQVANLAEDAALEIGANSLLARIGALYHDIGKMETPAFFIENQVNIENPHNKISPLKSAKIITGHVTNGVILAEKYGIPNQIINFIKISSWDITCILFLQNP